jgi:hypothetical protein
VKRALATVAAAALATLAAAAPAQAGDPIMPLDQVHKGMQCTGYSVIQGTTISSFDVEVIDVTPAGILISASGPAVDGTGLGEGFSGSPIYCDDGDGVQRNIGAVGYGIGEYGNRKALATPIETILASPVNPPRHRSAHGKLDARMRPLLAPLTISGLSRPMQQLVIRAGARAGRTIYAAPAAPGATFPPQVLQPGSSLAVGLSSGDIQLSAIGTVSYTDGPNVWGFGHALDAAGARALLLQDAYVYDVINNPVAAGDLTSYKLAAPGHDLGTLSDDTLDAVVGTVGKLPALIPVTVHVLDLDTGATDTLAAQATDETSLDLPSSLDLIAAIAVGDAGIKILDSFPPRQSGTLCMRIAIRERSAPLRFCNRYAGAASDLMINDATRAIALVLDFKNAKHPRLHVESIDADEGIARGLKQGFIAGVSMPRRLQRGHHVRARIRLRIGSSPLQTKVIRFRVPASLPAGRALMTLSGTRADDELSPADEEALFDPGLENQDVQAPSSLAALARRVAGIHRFHGLNVRFRSAGKHPRVRRARAAAPGGSDPILRISGSTRLRVTIR